MKKMFLAACGSIALAFCGCQIPRELAEPGSRYHPTNHTGTPALPAGFCRVALMPIATQVDLPASTVPKESLQRMLHSELRKAKRFEVVPVSSTQLVQWTGRAAWRTDELLPTNLLARVKEETAAQGILFPVVTAYRAYPPLAIGWDLRLVDLRSEKVLWAADEVMDAGSPSVARAARDYRAAQINQGPDGEAPVLQSPSQFSQFSAAVLTATLSAQAR